MVTPYPIVNTGWRWL